MFGIQALKSTLDLVSVLEQRGLKFVRRGENLFARCPFHKDSNPSLCVNPKTQLWSCFGCGAGGDVFTFVMKQDGVGFVEAVKTLCKKDIQGKDLTDLNHERQSWEEKQVDRPAQAVLDRIVDHWQANLAHSRPRKSLTDRGLWSPEILRALKVGYASGRLSQLLPKEGKLRRQLKELGILNDSGNEFFYDRVVVPIFDEAGILTCVYGRSLMAVSQVPHLYLPGPRRGVFNPAGVQEGGAVILAESLFDALSLLVLGFVNVTASFGTNGFTADLRALMLRRKVSRVYCAYDSDPAGDHAADQLAHDLAGHGIEVLRVELPTKDPNEFLKAKGTRETFQKFLDDAKLMEAPGRPVKPSPESLSKENEREEGSSGFEITLGDRTYRVEGVPVRESGALRVLLRVSREGKSFVDMVNLYSDRARATFLGKLHTVFRGKVTKTLLEEDIFAVLDEVEVRVKPLEEGDAKKPLMTPAEEKEALELLKSPNLLELVIVGLSALGVVGEEDNKLLAYLVATSRKLGKPLSLSVISRASAGKSWLLNRVVDLMPPEEVLRYTRMSPRALFYSEPGQYKHKILFIEEAIGAKDADLGVRSMQSEKRVANLATMTDLKTGVLKTQENVVEGPLTYLTSSVEPLDHETATRSFEMAIDESADQTAKIVMNLMKERELDGIKASLTSKAMVRKYQNAQRLLRPLLVVNPFATRLTFPSRTLRLRREVDKYLSLIETIALLHQHQRPVKRLDHEGETYEYVEVIPSDIDTANRLMAGCLARALSDLPGPAQELLLKIRDYVEAEGTKRGEDPLSLSFNRREIREWVGWSDYQVRLYLDILAELEYVQIVGGAFGKRYVYTLSPEHQLLVQAGLSLEETIEALGLTAAKKLGGSATPNLATP